MPLDLHTITSAPLLTDLLSARAATIPRVLADVRSRVTHDSALARAASQVNLDEQFVLRYVLSAESRTPDRGAAFVRRVADAVLATLRFRLDHFDAFERLKTDTSPVCNYDMPAYLTGDLGVHLCGVTFMALAEDAPGLKTKSVEELVLQMSLYNERIRLALDKRARETGRLAKCAIICDMRGFSVVHLTSKLLKIIGQNSKLNEMHQPQLLLTSFVVNVGSAFRLMWSIGAPFLSASTREKTVVCAGSTTKARAAGTAAVDACPFLRKLDAQLRAAGFPSVSDAVPKALAGTGVFPGDVMAAKLG